MSLREPAQSKTNTDTVQRNPEGITPTCSLSSVLQNNDRLPHSQKSWFLHVSKGTSVKRGQIPTSSFHFAEGGSTFSVLSSHVLAPAGHTSLCFSPGKDVDTHTSPCGHSAAAREWGSCHAWGLCSPGRSLQAEWWGRADRWLQLPALHFGGEKSAKPYIRGINLLY